MKNTVSLGIFTAMALAGAASAQVPTAPGGYVSHESVNYGYADVLRADAVYETVRFREPREECYDEPVTVRERGGGDPTGGTVLGAIIGGVVGNQVGSGNGRKAATAAGAVIGGAIGRDVDRRNGGPDRVYESTERRCRVVDVEREDRRIAGYDVEYRYKGDIFVSRLDYDPGNKLRVRVTVAPAD
ncbi:MAG: glycine zipper 2TM domain-containing protein [Chiayiivirga sp.]|jgi:uncharacterized protein YcfJ|uniref:glycine zipper 2TM domain-containing protein n=1 Tax=Chiayiivirga sp. TaxID=2041042 RepID=UPI0025BC7063|nr:glycine zipper 2TM domain-containing protein [Chiayiivirga sp.]MCI1709143.1 glycine zipper 2TM domain-containing protein [Chiayiivirga sp.]MCI1729242.1 glycine zipper 2TM domain-containing protein [Chiayiivirga sp.]